MGYILIRNICCSSNKMEQLLARQKFLCRSSGQCFRADSFLVLGKSSGPPAHLTMQYQPTSSRAMLKARHIKHVLPILLTQNSEFSSVCKGSPRKCYSMLWQPFHRDCRSLLNAMAVIYIVSYSNNNDWDEFSWTWNAPDSVNNIFPLCLKKSFHLKNRLVFKISCIMSKSIWVFVHMGTSISLLSLYIHIPSHFTSRSIYCTQEHILPSPVHAHVHLSSLSVHFLSPLTLTQVMKIILGLVYFKFCAKKNKFTAPDSVCFCCILGS